MDGMIFDIQRCSFVDGPGIRTTVFFKGCNLRCLWCHNPESQSSGPQLMFHREKCVHCGNCETVCPHRNEVCAACGACAAVCPMEARELCGRRISAEEVMETICRDRLFYETSGGGVTFSGGECMLQMDFLETLLSMCRSAGIRTAVDTAGAVPWERFERILGLTDVFLYDLKCVTAEKHRLGTGMDNGEILENLRKLSEYGASVIIRVPLIPGFNDDSEEITQMREFLHTIRYMDLNVLPYHRLGVSKADAIGLSQTSFPVPEPEYAESIRRLLTGMDRDASK